MKLSKEDIKSLYFQARFEIEEGELEEAVGYFNHLIEEISILDKVDISGLAPYERNGQGYLELREDVVEKGLDRERALEFSENREYGFFKLQRVVD